MAAWLNMLENGKRVDRIERKIWLNLIYLRQKTDYKELSTNFFKHMFVEISLRVIEMRTSERAPKFPILIWEFKGFNLNKKNKLLS